MPSTKNTASRISSTFKNMITLCPGEISSYGKCLSKNADENSIDKDVCKNEFQLLKSCFKKSRMKK
jgi:hypothetical protein